MNCKKGDLAIIVGCTVDPTVNGKIVRCVEYEPLAGIPAWQIDPTIPTTDGTGYYDAIVDKRLRPIRDPGDNEVDEMVRIAGNPRRVKSSALQEYLRVTKDLSR